MSKGHRRDETAFPGWYVELQANVLRQLPRPGRISQQRADELNRNLENLKKALDVVLLPEPPVEDYLSRVMTVTIPYLSPLDPRNFLSELQKNGVRVNRVPVEFSDSSRFGLPVKGSEETQLKIFQSRSQLDASRFVLGNPVVSLGQIAWLLEQQPKGEDGFLFNRGLRSLFFVEDVQDLHWMIDVQFHENFRFRGADKAGYWCVYAYPCYKPFVDPSDLLFLPGF